jgi:hypothetical protein
VGRGERTRYALLAVAALLAGLGAGTVVPALATGRVASRELTVEVAGEGAVAFSDGDVPPCSAVCQTHEPPDRVVFLTETPAQGYEFAGWLEGCSGTGAVCGVTAAATPVVKASFVFHGDLEVTTFGPGTVTSEPGGIDCGPTSADCQQSGTGQVTLMAASASGATFAGWGGACAQFGNAPCTVDNSAFQGVTATFVPTTPAAGPQSLAINHPGIALTSSSGALGPCLLANPCATTLAGGSLFTITAGGSFEDNPFQAPPQANWVRGCVGAWPVCAVAVDAPTTISIEPSSAATTPTTTSAADLTVEVTGGGQLRLATPGYVQCQHASAWSHPCEVLPDASTFSLIARPDREHRFLEWGGGALFGVCTKVHSPLCTGSLEAGLPGLAAVFS